MCSNKSGGKKEKQFCYRIKKKINKLEENLFCRRGNIKAGYDLCYNVHLNILSKPKTVLNFTWPNSPGKPK